MLSPAVRNEVLERCQALKQIPYLVACAEQMTPDEFSGNIVLVGVVRVGQDDLPPELVQLVVEIQENYEEFVSIVASVMYDTHVSN